MRFESFSRHIGVGESPSPRPASQGRTFVRPIFSREVGTGRSFLVVPRESTSVFFGSCLVCRTQSPLPQPACLLIGRCYMLFTELQSVFDRYALATPIHTGSGRNRLSSFFSIGPYKLRMTSSTSLSSKLATLHMKATSAVWNIGVARERWRFRAVVLKLLNDCLFS